ncbi:hypothetical protein BDY24DRAFT_416291 [Mrakia frigida]|uniref:uncharacterized protein n=1 Tax=Mrakia frigida TaxID=29902 RepID=UPI003FCBFF15
MSGESLSEILSTIPFLELLQSIPFSELIAAIPPSEIQPLSLVAQKIGISLALLLRTTAGVTILLGVLGSVHGIQRIVEMFRRGKRERRREGLERERGQRGKEGLRLRRYEVLMESLDVNRAGGLAVWLVEYLEGVKREKGLKGEVLVFYDGGVIASQLRRLVSERDLSIEIFTDFEQLLARAATMRSTLETEEDEEIYISIPVLKSGIYPLRIPSNIGDLGEVGIYGIQGLDGEDLIELAITRSPKADLSKVVFHDVGVSIVGTYEKDEKLHTFRRRLRVEGRAGLVSVGLLGCAGCVAYLAAGRRTAYVALLGALGFSSLAGDVGLRQFCNDLVLRDLYSDSETQL